MLISTINRKMIAFNPKSMEYTWENEETKFVFCREFCSLAPDQPQEDYTVYIVTITSPVCDWSVAYRFSQLSELNKRVSVYNALTFVDS